MVGIKAGEEGALTSLGKLAARYDAGCQRDRSFTRFQPRPRISSALFPSFHAVPIEPNRAAKYQRGACLSVTSYRVFATCPRGGKIRNSKSDAAVDRTTSGSGVAEDHVANRVNDSRLKFNVRCVTVRSRACSPVPPLFLFFLLFFSFLSKPKIRNGEFGGGGGRLAIGYADTDGWHPCLV